MDERIFMGRSLVHFPLWKVVRKGISKPDFMLEGIPLMRIVEEVRLTVGIYEGDFKGFIRLYLKDNPICFCW